MILVPIIENWMLFGYVLFIFLNGLDLWVTKVILDAPEGKEWNPVMRWIHKKLGMYGMGIIKSLLLFWFGLQYHFRVLDLYNIFYLNFMFSVVIYMMYRDALNAGLKEKLNPFNLLVKPSH